jgi:CopG family nickel-responsive transcriptional regulator
MGKIIRFGVSMDESLVTLLDQITEDRHFPNRSETIRSLIREQVLQQNIEDPNSLVTAIISLTYHYKTTLDRVPLSQYPTMKIITNLQMHLEKEIVIKILVVSGQCSEVKEWADKVLAQKNVAGNINIAATETLYTQLRP